MNRAQGRREEGITLGIVDNGRRTGVRGGGRTGVRGGGRKESQCIMYVCYSPYTHLTCTTG